MDILQVYDMELSSNSDKQFVTMCCDLCIGHQSEALWNDVSYHICVFDQ